MEQFYSPWELEKKNHPFDYSECIEKSITERIGSRFLELSALDVAENFLNPVNYDAYPEYLMSIAYPVWFYLITERLYNGFYRSLDALKWDISLLASNAVFFNDPKSLIAKDAMKFAEMALSIVDDPDNTSVGSSSRRKRSTRFSQEPAAAPSSELFYEEPLKRAPRSETKKPSRLVRKSPRLPSTNLFISLPTPKKYSLRNRVTSDDDEEEEEERIPESELTMIESMLTDDDVEEDSRVFDSDSFIDSFSEEEQEDDFYGSSSEEEEKGKQIIKRVLKPRYSTFFNFLEKASLRRFPAGRVQEDDE